MRSGNAFAIFSPASAEYHMRQFGRFKIQRTFFEPMKMFEELEGVQNIGPFCVATFPEIPYNSNIFQSKILYAIETSGTMGNSILI
jgi:hypothetical protein